MQKTKTVQVGDKTFTVNELQMKIIWKLLNNDKQKKASIFDQGREILSLACPELTNEALLELYPSEIKELWAVFEEVNADFLGVAREVGLGEALIGTIKATITTSIKQSVFLLLRDTAQKSGTTATGFFSKHWKH